MTIRDGHHCYFDPNYQFFVKICFYISATCFFVLPVSILCVLYALMGRRLYSAAGVFNEFRQSKSSAPNSYASPSMGLEQIPRTTRRHSSSASVLTGYPSTQRSAKTSLATLSVQIQSMKKSAFKMLCKYNIFRIMRSRSDMIDTDKLIALIVRLSIRD